MPKKARKKKAQEESSTSKQQHFIICPFTDEKVYITTVTLSQLKQIGSKKKTSSSNRKELVRIPSKSIREECYQQAALALQAKEVQALPLYGQRPWKVSIKVSENSNSKRKKSPLFRWFRGELELAVLPHYLEKIPDGPPNKVLQYRGKTQRENQQEREDNSEIKATDLGERTISNLTSVAWTSDEYDIPTVSIKWTSPNLEHSFKSRKAAWDHAFGTLLDHQVFCDRILRGYGARGQELAPHKPTRAQALKAGRIRFLRDGLWVVGQEESWQQQRALERAAKQQQQQEEEECTETPGTETAATCEEPPTKPRRRRVTGMQYYVKCRRDKFRADKLEQLKAEAAAKNNSTVRTSVPKSSAQTNFGSLVQNVEHATLPNESRGVESAVTTVMQRAEAPPSGATVSSCTEPEQSHNIIHTVTHTEIENPAVASKMQNTASNMSETSTVNKTQGVVSPPPSGATASSCKEPQQSYNSNHTTTQIENIPAVVSEMQNTASITSETSPVNTTTKGPPKIRYTLADADKELKLAWKTLSENEQEEWSAKAKEYQDSLPDLPKAAAPTNHKKGRYFTPLECFLRHCRSEYRHQKLAGLKAAASVQESKDETTTTATTTPPTIRFTLKDAQNDLRVVWKTLSEEEKKEWKERAEKERQEHERNIAEAMTTENTAGKDNVSNSDAVVKPPPTSSGSRVLEVTTLEDASTPTDTQEIMCASESSSGDCDAVRVTPSPPLEPLVSGGTEVASCDDDKAVEETKAVVVKRKRKSTAQMKKITPSFHWRLGLEEIELCYSAAMDHYHKVMHTVKARALFSELADGFDLLRERGRGRYDMELPIFDTEQFSFLTDIYKATWMPIVREILGQDVILIHKGVFMSMPGAEAQVYHQDGPHLTERYQRPCHAVNVFIPLVDLTMRNGPTEFCLGTHILGNEDFVRERAETPVVTAGTPVIFDYRLGHRGLGNSSDSCRPIVYCTYAASANGKEFRDSVNFSRKRYRKIGDLVALPPSREERARKRHCR